MEKNESRRNTIKRREFIKTTAAAGAAMVLPCFGPFSSAPDATDVYYSTLADALNRLPNAFPRTKSNVEVLLLKKIFTPEEAWLAGQMSVEREAVDSIAKRVDLPVDDVRERLEKLSERGFVWGGRDTYRLAPFIVGIYESQWEVMDHELAHLFEEWMDEGGAEFMRPRPAIHRVIPAQSAVKSEWILPYDDIKAILKKMKSFRVRDCICRLQQDELEERQCDFPLKTCLTFTPFERSPSERDITLEDALALIDETEEVGLVHSVSNVAGGFYYVCNCCGCCCGILRGITEWGIEKSVAAANYYVDIDPDLCQGCGKCVDRCQMKAVSIQNGVSVVDRDKCIGCGLCVTGCPFGIAKLEPKSEDQIVPPPENLMVWEKERLKNRGLLKSD